jgi:hypothetical protein
MFNYDWFHGSGLEQQIAEARRRCMAHRFPDAAQQQRGNGNAEYERYLAEIETHTVLHLKDGLSYEMREIANIGTNSALAFECVPVDESYQVGAYVVVVPFEDIARVEVFAVHPDDKPADNLRIPGFRSGAADTRE